MLEPLGSQILFGRKRATTIDYILACSRISRFSVQQISQLLQVSSSTIRRNLSQFQISVRNPYSVVTDANLDSIVSGYKFNIPIAGTAF